MTTIRDNGGEMGPRKTAQHRRAIHTAITKFFVYDLIFN